MNFLRDDSPFMDALGKLSDIVICNIMFCIFSIPLFTIGAALTALYASMQALVDGREPNSVFRAFWQAFCSNFKQSTAIWLVTVGACGFLFAFYKATGLLGGGMLLMYRITFFLLCILFAVGFQYFFPLQAQFSNRVKYTLRNSWLLALLAFPWTLLSLALTVGVTILSFTAFGRNFYNGFFFWAVIGFGLLTYLNSFLFRQAFKKIAPEHWEEHETEKAEGALFTDEQHRKPGNDWSMDNSTSAYQDWNRRS